jgi:hypothetical protein
MQPVLPPEMPNRFPLHESSRGAGGSRRGFVDLKGVAALLNYCVAVAPGWEP